MKRKKLSFRAGRRICGLLLAALAATVPSQADEELFLNSAFDANATGWSWEDWSAAGSSAEFDATQNSAILGGSAASGSLKLVNNFTAVEGYQQAVYTVSLPAPQDFVGSVGAISFDVKVDPASAPRAEGDYGFLEVILRQGDGWEWVGLPGTRLMGNEWQRVTFQTPKSGVDSIRAITLKLGDNDFFGPVTLNIDNVAYSTNPDDVWITGADNGSEDVTPEGWVWENWSVTGVVSFDPLDVRGRDTSGSIKLEHAFEERPNDYQQTVFTYLLPSGNVNAARDYSHVNLDVRVAPGSTPRAAGDYGYWEIFLRNGAGWDWIPTEINGASGIRLTNTEWQRLSFKVPASAGDVHRLTFKTGENSLLGPITLNLDNITWTHNTTPPPPPTLSLKRAESGLSLVTTSTDAYGRHNIYTTDNVSYSFAGSTEPVSYSFTIGKFPDATAYPGFQAHIFLVPGAPGNASSPDWNEPTLIFMDIKAGANNTGNATFRIKTEQPGGNSELYAAGLTNVNSATIAGTWTLTANGNIFTMTAPDGTVSGPIDIGQEAADLFADGYLRVYFGVQANADANKGQSARVAKIEIKRGEAILLSDDFTGEELNLELWTANATAGGVFFVPSSEASWIVNWTLPDTNFKLQATPSLTNPNWTDLDATASTVTIGLMKQATIPVSSLPTGSTAFIRMVQADEPVEPANL
jgi:hypothetical protein